MFDVLIIGGAFLAFHVHLFWGLRKIWILSAEKKSEYSHQKRLLCKAIFNMPMGLHRVV
jgi:hypothetical protein